MCGAAEAVAAVTEVAGRVPGEALCGGGTGTDGGVVRSRGTVGSASGSAVR
ncbi:hypothetical protein Aph02nite_77220 [Actinoplanes philippinensis]|nr:hypothetical protein Aph02nite_77220 [Actinoplanes philippinensis]